VNVVSADSQPGHRTDRHPASPWLLAALLVCLLAGLLRALPLLSHTPLIALANSFDEVRYSACFDLYPDRPAEIPPFENSPYAPYSRYAFRASDMPMCYWSSELAFQAVAAGVYHVQAQLTGAESFSVRWLGAFKFAALLLVWAAFGVAWWRRGEPMLALANGLLLPLLFADPANTIYANTFYAEWTTLLALYALCGLIVLCDGQRATRRAAVGLAVAAFALAMSKIQHLVLPLICAAIVFGFGYWRERHWTWQAKAVLFGALAGLSLQVAQLHRDSDAIRNISIANHTDLVFTAMLPATHDAAGLLQTLGVAPDCARFAGMRAWQLPWGSPQQACPSLANVTRGRELAALLREPMLGLRMYWNAAQALDSWLAPGLGLVEGGDFAGLPSGFFSASGLVARAPARTLVLGLPVALFAVLVAWPRRPSRLRLFGALVSAVMLATLGVDVLGDGLADTPKQCHLVFNAALAWWICLLAPGAARVLAWRRPALPQPA